MITKGIVGVFELLISATLTYSDCFKDLFYRHLFLFHFDDGGVARMLFLEVCNNSIVLIVFGFLFLFNSVSFRVNGIFIGIIEVLIFVTIVKRENLITILQWIVTFVIMFFGTFGTHP